ncbi:unnamed protein product [Effrenium voratum]|nr:unnamed protein product [Effrenium voratum]
MAFACYARVARCRAAHLSLWSRQVNLALDRRGLASARVLSERRPALCFAEQRLPGVAGMLVSELAASSECEATEMLDSLSDLVVLIDLLGVSSRWVCTFQHARTICGQD